MIRRRNASLGQDARGVTIVEFALVMPVMLILIMGLAELAYRIYVQSVLTGAVQKAGRDSGIQGGAQQSATIDAAVMKMVWSVASNATYNSTRDSYANFTYISGEPFTDTNANGVRDAGECYSDVNGNKGYDSDISTDGQGGASDAVVYTMTITYPHLFPVPTLLGWSASQTIHATTILKNQPYASQATAATPAIICT
jgi:Flp pilus assembly protein TadG